MRPSPALEPARTTRPPRWRRTARAASAALLASLLLAPSATSAATRPDLLPDCAFGASARGLHDYESQVQRDAWTYADGLQDTSQTERLDAARTFAAAEAAYVYGLPLVKLHDTVRNFRFRNTIVSVAALANPDSRSVVSPNVDTAYTVGWLSLTQGPLVIDVPDTDGRFYTFQFMDAWTNSFAYVGSGSTGTKAGSYLLVPPGWAGEVPDGVQVLHSPTNTVWLLGRTLVDGPEDMKQVKPILQAYTATPLAEWQTGARGHSLVLDSQPSQPKTVPPTGTDFIATLNQELTIDPPPGPQTCVIEALAPAGVQMPDSSPAAVQAADAANVVGDPSGSTQSNPTNDAIAAGTTAAQQLLTDAAQDFSAATSRGHEGWSFMVDRWIGDFARKYLGRGVIATNFLGANVPRIAVYPTSYADRRGRELTGKHRYTITFDKGQLPPVNAFWSLTMYKDDNFLYANKIDRYAVGDRADGLRFDKDGSLTIVVQHEEPRTAAQRANWLPAPAGRFHLIMRMYLPKQSVFDGGYSPPPFVRVRD